MPITAGMSMIQNQLKSAFNMGAGGTPSATSQMIAAAIASAVPMAMIPGTPPIPLSPSGMSAAANMLKSAFNMGAGGTPSMTAQMIASAISLIAPLCPPTGMTLLKTQLENVFNMGASGKPDMTAQMIALAVCNFYQMGPTI
jgi:hypothetical protein